MLCPNSQGAWSKTLSGSQEAATSRITTNLLLLVQSPNPASLYSQMPSFIASLVNQCGNQKKKLKGCLTPFWQFKETVFGTCRHFMAAIRHYQDNQVPIDAIQMLLRTQYLEHDKRVRLSKAYK